MRSPEGPLMYSSRTRHGVLWFLSELTWFMAHGQSQSVGRPSATLCETADRRRRTYWRKYC